MNIQTKIEESSNNLVADALELEDIIADGVVTPAERRQLLDIAERLKQEAVRVEDVANDVQYVKQVLTMGRDNAPNRHLAEKERRTQAMISKHLAGKAQKARTPGTRQMLQESRTEYTARR